jgi:hypothetical protein
MNGCIDVRKQISDIIKEADWVEYQYAYIHTVPKVQVEQTSAGCPIQSLFMQSLRREAASPVYIQT